MSETAPYAPPPMPPEDAGAAKEPVFEIPAGGPQTASNAADDFDLGDDANNPPPKPGAWKTRGQRLEEEADDKTLESVMRMLRGETTEDKKTILEKVALVLVSMLSAQKSIESACLATGISQGEFSLYLLRNPTWQRYCEKLIRQNLIAQGSKIPEILNKIENASGQDGVSVANLRAALAGAERAFSAGHKVKSGGGGESAKKTPPGIGGIGGLTAEKKDSYDDEEQAKYDKEREESRRKFKNREGATGSGT